MRKSCAACLTSLNRCPPLWIHVWHIYQEQARSDLRGGGAVGAVHVSEAPCMSAVMLHMAFTHSGSSSGTARLGSACYTPPPAGSLCDPAV